MHVRVDFFDFLERVFEGAHVPGFRFRSSSSLCCGGLPPFHLGLGVILGLEPGISSLDFGIALQSQTSCLLLTGRFIH